MSKKHKRASNAQPITHIQAARRLTKMGYCVTTDGKGYLEPTGFLKVRKKGKTRVLYMTKDGLVGFYRHKLWKISKGE